MDNETVENRKKTFNDVLILLSEEALLDENKSQKFLELSSNIQDLDLSKSSLDLSKDLLNLCYESDSVRPEYIAKNLKDIISSDETAELDLEKIDELSKTFNQEVLKYQAREQNLISTIIENDIEDRAMELEIFSNSHESMILNPKKLKESQELELELLGDDVAIGSFVPEKENYDLGPILQNEAKRLKAKRENQNKEPENSLQENQSNEVESMNNEKVEVEEIQDNFFTKWLKERKERKEEEKAEKEKLEDMSKYNPFLHFNKKDHKKFQEYYFNKLEEEKDFKLNKKPYKFYSSRKALYDDANKVMMTMKFDRVSGNANTAFIPKITKDSLYIAFEALPPKHHKIQLMEPTDENLEALRDCLQQRIDNGLPIDQIKCARRVNKKVKKLLKEMQEQHELVLGKDLKLLDEEPVETPNQKPDLENTPDDSPENSGGMENKADNSDLENNSDEANKVDNKESSNKNTAAAAAAAADVSEDNNGYMPENGYIPDSAYHDESFPDPHYDPDYQPFDHSNYDPQDFGMPDFDTEDPGAGMSSFENEEQNMNSDFNPDFNFDDLDSASEELNNLSKAQNNESESPMQEQNISDEERQLKELESELSNSDVTSKNQEDSLEKEQKNQRRKSRRP